MKIELLYILKWTICFLIIYMGQKISNTYISGGITGMIAFTINEIMNGYIEEKKK